MFKKSSFLTVFKAILGLLLALPLSLFTLVQLNMLTFPVFVTTVIRAYCTATTVVTLVSPLSFGNYVVDHFKLKGAAAYFIRIACTVCISVTIISFIMMFCEMGFQLGSAFIPAWASGLPPLILSAFICFSVFMIPVQKLARAICTKEG